MLRRLVEVTAEVIEPSSGPARWHSDWTFGRIDADRLACLWDSERTRDLSVRTTE